MLDVHTYKVTRDLKYKLPYRTTLVEKTFFSQNMYEPVCMCVSVCLCVCGARQTLSLNYIIRRLFTFFLIFESRSYQVSQADLKLIHTTLASTFQVLGI